jgi:hypothetical protein
VKRAWILGVVCVVAGVTGWFVLRFTAHGQGWADNVVWPILAGITGAGAAVLCQAALNHRRSGRHA